LIKRGERKLGRRAVSGILLSLLLTSVLTFAFNIQPVEASETIYILWDGRVLPYTAPIKREKSRLYVFTDNISAQIRVFMDNIAIDGAGYTLQDPVGGHTKGIDLTLRKNVTLRNMSIKGFYYGIYLFVSSSNNISCNYMTNNRYGIRADYSKNNIISRNNITGNNEGIQLLYSSGNRIAQNNITANTEESDKGVITGAGILIIYSHSNNISGNDVTDNIDGILLGGSTFNSVGENHIASNIYSASSSGIMIVGSSSNTIFGNDLVTNEDGIYFHRSLSNLIYNNNFLNNTRQVYDVSWGHPFPPPSISTWDSGYPSGGNFWSDYTTRYPDAQELDDSGIWDTPYFIDENNQDNYPLMEPWIRLPRTIGELKTKVEELGSEGQIDSEGIAKSLIAKLDTAQKMADKGKTDEARNILEDDFIPQVQNLSGTHITVEAADVLVKSAEYIASSL
jgi:parallel beta-helix repeat protein